MATRVLHLVLILMLLLPSRLPQALSEPPDLPYKTYLPMVANDWASAKIYLPLIENAFSPPLCQVTSQSPTDGTYMAASEEFDASWTIKNTGIETWRTDSMDIVYLSGDHIHTGSDLRAMSYDVSPGAQLSVTIHMKAPSFAGTYVENWSLHNDSRSLCQFFVMIRVP